MKKYVECTVPEAALRLIVEARSLDNRFCASCKFVFGLGYKEPPRGAAFLAAVNCSG
jgi:hypothetical protein